MPAIVSLHARSTWPISIDFTVLRLYVEGYSVEEAVEHLLSLRETQPNDPETAGEDRGRRVTFAPVDSTPQGETPILQEEVRQLDDEQLPITDAVSVSPPIPLDEIVEETEKVRQAMSENQPTSGIVKSKDKKINSKRKKKKKSKKSSHCFFLNDDYLDFQKRIQILEGLPSSDAAVLNSRLLYEEVFEQFQLYEILIEDGSLSAPHSFLSNHYIPFPVRERRALVELYYGVDDATCFHFFGSKLSQFDSIDLGVGGEKRGFLMRLLEPSSRVNATERQTPQHIKDQLALISEGSLRRQWENVKHVCTTVSMMYQGKGGLFVPRDTPLIQLVQQCYGLPNKLSLTYASMAFGFEHRLETNLFCHLRSFEECSSICTLISGMWCDESQLLLKKEMVEGCKHLVRLLEENRFLSELHLLVFGEILRNKWQVQLDEVQRAITTTNVQGGGGHRTEDHHSEPIDLTPSPHYLSNTASPVTAVVAPLVSGSSNNNSSNVNNSNSGANGTLHATLTQGTFSANNMFSRRFLLEFVFIMKHLGRMAMFISNGSINSALDLFYSRIYGTLESLSLRTPHSVSVMLAGGAVPGGAKNGEEDMLFSPNTNASDTFHSPVVAHRRTRSLDAETEQRTHEGNPLTDEKGLRGSFTVTADTFRTRRSMSKSSSTQHLDGSAVPPLGASLELQPSPSDPLPSLEPLACLVNTSLTHPAAALLNIKVVPGSPPPPRSCSNANLGEEETHEESRDLSGEALDRRGSPEIGAAEEVPTLAMSAQGVSVSSFAESGCSTRSQMADGSSTGTTTRASSGPLRNSTVHQIVRKALDKRYLRELCLFLNLLPTMWPKLTLPLSDTDRSLGGRALSDLSLALKVVTQVLMASDDYSEG